MVVAVVRAPLWAALFLGPLMSYCVFLVCAVAGPPTRILKPWAGVWVGGCCGRFFFCFFPDQSEKILCFGLVEVVPIECLGTIRLAALV